MNRVEISASTIVAAYHHAWTHRRFEEAIELLDPEVRIEVPINAYPTRESFGEALRGFGSLVDRAELLASFGGEEEALLLYDMQVRGLGVLRIAEHFTLRDGKIVRLRQIHDTAPIRAMQAGA